MIGHGWKTDNGFRVGYLNHLADEKMKVFPGTDIRSSPHINSKMYVWKKHFGMVYALLGSYGIGWNETTKMFERSDKHWEKAIKDDPSCKMLRHKPWPQYNHWLEIFGKDRANGGGAEDCDDVANAVNQEQTQTEHQASPDFEGVNGYTHTSVEHEATSIGVQSMCSQRTSSGCSKKTNKGKRKLMEVVEPLVKASDKFTDKADVRLGELTHLMAHEHKLRKRQFTRRFRV
ncbi:hypothetical protein BUALT_Bualt01G0028300 [Buddleja alternifolia]|uniref:Myb/SANT-like domain-containing protein n=1 Tax=Buddleja alternifolia TaxID=168488 RepID=A0AAV6YCM3_9LAMI|nr:hypothetical protein BUALT_Bualt01G0028300 [Buddleja alternifolia]